MRNLIHNHERETYVQLNREQRAPLGQFLTPKPIAEFMASLFNARWHELRLLDAGAGTGALTAALVSRLCNERHKPKKISVTAFEIDSILIRPLQTTLSACQEACELAGIVFSATVNNIDFIAASVPAIKRDLFVPEQPSFNAAIVNPPYRKILSNSSTRLLLRSAGIETSNLYSAFVALITKLLDEDGEVVAITPRSFCNGLYFKPFRVGFLKTMSLCRLHVFESRTAAFSHDNVLQENIIIHAIKGHGTPKNVIISSSSGEPNDTAIAHKVDYHDVVMPNDPEQFIHLLIDGKKTITKLSKKQLPATLADLGLSVSTGRIVDFRVKSYLRKEPTMNTVPLIYSCHFNGGFVHWPKEKSRKPNAIVCEKQTREMFVPAGTYVLVKRISAKEERRRIVACIYDSKRIPASLVAFENHLNYFHSNGHGMPMVLARGLAAFLNSTIVDSYFRQFSGHTQVNATDLRALNYPSKAALERLGHRIDDPGMTQERLDDQVEQEIFQWRAESKQR